MTALKPRIVLDRCDDVPDPPYLIYGRAECINCLAFCWLSSEVVKLIGSRRALPLCFACAKLHLA